MEICVDEEDIAEIEATTGAGKGVFAFQRIGEDGAGGDPGGDESEEESCGDAEEEGIEKDARVDGDGDVERDGRGEMEGGEPACGGRWRAERRRCLRPGRAGRFR